MAAFPYLGCNIYLNNSYWVALYCNLSKAHWRWGIVTKFLVNSGVTMQSHLMMYNTVLHTVFICGGKSWVVTDAVLKVMEGSHHRAHRRIAGISVW